jgi:DNA-binding transcriptional LysR family regulator
MIAKTQDLQSKLRWDDVRVFLALFRELSLGRAGRRVGLDTSTVSRRLSALEEVLGGRLFERTRQGLVATQRARQILAAAEGIEAAHARLVRDASAAETIAEGTVRVSVPPGVADAFVAPLLVRLRARHPRISIELDASTRALDLTRHEADLALRSIAPAGADLVVTQLLRAPWLVVGAPALVQELGPVAHWKDVPWIAWDRDLAGFPPSVWLERYARGAEIVLRTSHFGAQLAAAETGLGVLLAPAPYVARHKLVAVRHSKGLAASVQRLPVDTLWLVGARASRDVPRIAAVWEFLAAEMRRYAANPARRSRA